MKTTLLSTIIFFSISALFADDLYFMQGIGVNGSPSGNNPVYTADSANWQTTSDTATAQRAGKNPTATDNVFFMDYNFVKDGDTDKNPYMILVSDPSPNAAVSTLSASSHNASTAFAVNNLTVTYSSSYLFRGQTQSKEYKLNAYNTNSDISRNNFTVNGLLTVNGGKNILIVGDNDSPGVTYNTRALVDISQVAVSAEADLPTGYTSSLQLTNYIQELRVGVTKTGDVYAANAKTSTVAANSSLILGGIYNEAVYGRSKAYVGNITNSGTTSLKSVDFDVLGAIQNNNAFTISDSANVNLKNTFTNAADASFSLDTGNFTIEDSFTNNGIFSVKKSTVDVLGTLNFVKAATDANTYNTTFATSTLNVKDGGEILITGSMQLDTGNLNIEKGGKITVNSTSNWSFLFGKNSTDLMTIAGEFVLTRGTIRFQNGTVDVTGSFTQNGGGVNFNTNTTMNFKAGSNYTMSTTSLNSSTVNFEKGANVTVTGGTLWVSAGATLNVYNNFLKNKGDVKTYGTINVKDGGVMTIDSGVTLEDVNAGVTSMVATTLNVEGTLRNNGTIKLYNGKGSKINVNGGNLIVANDVLIENASIFQFTSGKLTFSGEDIALIGGIRIDADSSFLGTVLASDFAFINIVEDNIYKLISFGSADNFNASLKALNGTVYTYGDYEGTFFTDATSLNITFTYIPEPATIAAILGALAIGLAIYRRRR